MALGCPGLMKGIKRRARQGQDDDFFPRSWPVQCAMGVVPGDSACWTRHAVGRVAHQDRICRHLFDIGYPSSTHELQLRRADSSVPSEGSKLFDDFAKKIGKLAQN